MSAILSHMSAIQGEHSNFERYVPMRSHDFENVKKFFLDFFYYTKMFLKNLLKKTFYDINFL
jgi:hypothetical protein